MSIIKIGAFSVVKSGDTYRVNAVSNVLDEQGMLIESNKRDSFFVVDPEMETAISAAEKLIKAKVESLNPTLVNPTL